MMLVRAALIQLLGALEDALGLPRTMQKSDDRRALRPERLIDRTSGNPQS
jgi:hypothetical protein